MRLKVDFKFDAAHRLMKYEGRCNSIHGHRWKVCVEFYGGVDPKSGMVKDFKEIKQDLNVLFDDFDHAIILNPADLDLIKFVSKNKWRYVLMPKGNPTAENLAKWFFSRIQGYFDLNLISVEVWESEHCCAKKYRGGD